MTNSQKVTLISARTMRQRINAVDSYLDNARNTTDDNTRAGWMSAVESALRSLAGAKLYRSDHDLEEAQRQTIDRAMVAVMKYRPQEDEDEDEAKATSAEAAEAEDTITISVETWKRIRFALVWLAQDFDGAISFGQKIALTDRERHLWERMELLQRVARSTAEAHTDGVNIREIINDGAKTWVDVARLIS